jgi:polysaccharide export outer membrane protein
MRRLPLLTLALLAGLAVCGRAAAQDASGDLRLEPGDALRLAVRDEPTLSGDFAVVEPGRVLLPEIGFVSVAGRPFQEVAGEVRREYARILVDREVEVVPLVRVAVLGEVRQPGLYPVDPTQGVAEVLALAGGTTPTADARRLTLVRDGRPVPLRLEPGRDGPAGGLRSGDRLVVAERGPLRQNLNVLVGASASVLAAAVTSLLLR